MKNIILFFIIFIFLTGLMLTGCKEVNKMQAENTTSLRFHLNGSDKARYFPGDTVTLPCSLDITGYNGEILRLETLLFHNEVPVSKEETVLQKNEFINPEISFVTPQKDYTGYLVKVIVKDEEGKELATDTTAIDISSSWIKFPRYGYLCDYESSIPSEELIQQMNHYHINAIEYYDWHHLHHEPLPEGMTAENLSDWTDWAGRKISHETLTRYIAAAKEKNMVNMAYNMIYAGTDSFFKDANGNPTPPCQWQLFFKEGNPKGKGPFLFTMGDSPSGDGHLYFVNPLNPEWQNYIFAEENRALDALGFDGWHGDTIGEFGEMTDVNGNPLGYTEDGTAIYLVKDTYRSFLNNAKKALGKKYLSFNPVGAQGNEQANTSLTDVLYAEFWPWDAARDGELFNTYHAILREVERSREDSKAYSFDGVGKSLTVKAYINVDSKEEFMNDAAVLLMDSVSFASGGGRLELGNGNHMLHTAYYPDDKILMSDTLQKSIVRMYDFSVAYENLLRDGQYPIENKVEINDTPTSADGKSFTIWTYPKEDSEYQILHLINLRNNDNRWVDEKGKKKEPEIQKDLKVKFYTEREISSVYLASPDFSDCESLSLSHEKGTDKNGKYITFTVPSLQYWDMIYMK